LQVSNNGIRHAGRVGPFTAGTGIDLQNVHEVLLGVRNSTGSTVLIQKDKEKP
jgi:hypothetical protein